MHVRDEPLSIANVKQSLDRDVLNVAPNELAVLDVIVHIVVNVLRCVAVVDQTVADFVEEFYGRDFNTVELAIAQQNIY